MNKKAQTALQIGVILTTFVAILVGVILFQTVAQQAGEGTNLATLSNLSLGTITNGTVYYNTDYRSWAGTILVTNASDGVLIGSGNYTIANNQIDPTTTGLSVSLTPTADYPQFSGHIWNISVSTAQLVTYIANSGGRAMAGLIIIFFALAIAIVAIVPVLRSGALSLIGR